MRRLFVDSLLFVVVFVFSWMLLVPQLERQVFFIDEYEFLRKSYLFDLYFIKRNLTHPRWSDAGIESDAPQPKVGPYIFGLALHLAGVGDIRGTFEQNGFTTTKVNGRQWWQELWMKEPSKFPKELEEIFSYIMIGRRTAVLFSIASILLIYLLGVAVHSSVLGFVAAVLLLVNRLFRFEAGFAMTDTMQLSFFLLTLLFLTWWRGAWQTKRSVLLAALSIGIGISAALAAGVKVTGMLAMLFVLIHQAMTFFQERMTRSRKRRFLINTICMGIVFWGVFYALHPYLYRDTFHRLIYMYQARMEVAEVQYVRTFPQTYIPSKFAATRYILTRTVLPKSEYGNFSASWIPWDLMLLLGGTIFLMRDVFRRWKGSMPKLALMPLWIAFTCVALVWYLKHDWSRYYLTVVSGITFIEAYMLTHLFFKFGGSVLYDRLPE